MNDAQGSSTSGLTNRVSSPASTGGAGTTFEQHVGAYWLAQLLVGGIPPILTKATITEVSFQTERLGWKTDDFLIVCVAGTVTQKLAGQVKRTFTVSATDDECVKAIGDFWKDFKGDHFSKENDRFALVTLRGTNTLLEHFAGLLDCARASHDGADFEQRLNKPGFISSTAKRYCGVLQEIIGNFESNSLKAAEIWPFLSCLHVLSLDLFSSTRQMEAQIKSMLALTVLEGDAVASSESTWNELLVDASAAMAESRSLNREDLSESTRARHGVISTNNRRVLQALHDHTEPVLRAIRTTLGPQIHLPRAGLVQKVLDAIKDTQVVLVTGPAGGGKSAMVKDAISMLQPEHIIMGFRVEEFAQTHFDATLANAQVPASWSNLRAILGAQDRKILLIESVERLLEKTTRDAFTDLMNLAAEDQGLRIVLTCRDYSVNQVRASFLDPQCIRTTVIDVPPLDDDELAEVEAAFPALAIPFKSPALRNILRNPFVLDKALGISWSSEKSLPQNDRELRLLFWRDLVRRGQRVTPAMGRQREAVLQVIAVRRAQALSTHVSVRDLDVEAIESLRSDSLITSTDDIPFLVATAHDVLEDWAILQWLEERFVSEQSFKALSDAIGTYPAIRRSYRKWVAELVERDTSASESLFQSAVSETEISIQFRDDTLVSLLKAPSAPDFLARNESQLLANERKILKRIIHLLRVACVMTPDWLNGLSAQGSAFYVPEGSAWPAVLRIVRSNLSAFPDKERPLLLGLVEDSVRGVSWVAPNLDGAEDVAYISHSILDGLRGYGDADLCKRVLKIIAKIPLADPRSFEDALRGKNMRRNRRDLVLTVFQKLIFAGIEGIPAARDLPQVVISAGSDYMLASDGDITNERRYAHSHIDIDLYFGIRDGISNDSFPPSALRGPWLTLLRNHPNKAIDFFIKVFNHSADWYAHPRLHHPLESASEVELTFADGFTRKQWMNSRLWGLYRGMSVGSYPLESMLMALESWLLDAGKQKQEWLDSILVEILRRSDNAALSAVVASVATAYPEASGEALLVLLSVKDFIVGDRIRLGGEHQVDILTGMLPTIRTDTKIFESERKQSNNLPHRQHDLEVAIERLQLGPLAERVQSLLDHHLAALPPKQEQDGEDRLWRLAIHRMDLRQYTVSEAVDPDIPTRKAEQEDSPRRYVRFDPKPPEPDVQAMVDEGSSRSAALNARFGLLMWGHGVFHHDVEKHDPALWAGKLSEAQSMEPLTSEENGSRHAPGIIAAVCIRDRWDEMSSEQRDWCVDLVCTEVLRHADSIDSMECVQKNTWSADRACSYVLASLVHKPLDSTRTEQVKTAFVAALTHPIDQVRMYATWSIDETVWAAYGEFALRCVNAIATEAAIIDKKRGKEQLRDYYQRCDLGKIIADARFAIRERFWKDQGIASDAHIALDISDSFGQLSLKRILVIFGSVPKDPLSIAAFLQASHLLAYWWTNDEDSRHSSNKNSSSEADVSERIQDFLLRTSPEAAKQVLEPLLTTVNRHTRELKTVMQGLTAFQDTRPNTAQYWFLWDLIASAARGAKWISNLGSDRWPNGADLLSAVFLTSFWKDDVRHWRFLEGYAHHVHSLFQVLPATSITLDLYASFLYHIGERSLPGAFQHLADALRRGNAPDMLADSNTVFLLDVLLQRHVYGRPIELKRDDHIRKSVLFILDCLVESGSSAAFKMRDDFVTPISP